MDSLKATSHEAGRDRWARRSDGRGRPGGPTLPALARQTRAALACLRTRAFFFAAVSAIALGSARAAEPIVFGSIETQTAAGPLRGLWAKVRLDHPAVRVGATEPLTPASGDPAGTEVKLLPVNEWALANETTLAVNASFFGLINPKPAPGEDKVRYTTGAASDIRGLSKGSRGLVSPPDTKRGRGDPALLVYADRARVVYATETNLADVICAVAGLGDSEDGKQPGTLLVEGGRNTGATARVAPKLRHPRTAAGVTLDGRTLILLTVDGRQPGVSVGATLPEMADLLLELGAHDAIALDGGGSTSFFLKRADGSLLTNKPSDGNWRPVANHLGVWVQWPKSGK